MYLNEMIFLNNISAKVVVCNNTVQDECSDTQTFDALDGFNHISSDFRECVYAFFFYISK